MNSNWKFYLAFCLVTLYVVGINCATISANEPVETETEFKKQFNTSATTKKGQPQIVCLPEEVCNTTDLYNDSVLKDNVIFDCNGTELTKPTCTSEGFKVDENLIVEYTINCTKDEKEKDKDYEKDQDCWLQINLTPVEKPEKSTNGISVGLIVGIVILVVAISVGVVSYLGYRGKGPLKSFFNSS